jgi:hypothetical protein
VKILSSPGELADGAEIKEVEMSCSHYVTFHDEAELLLDLLSWQHKTGTFQPSIVPRLA